MNKNDIVEIDQNIASILHAKYKIHIYSTEANGRILYGAKKSDMQGITNLTIDFRGFNKMPCAMHFNGLDNIKSLHLLNCSERQYIYKLPPNLETLELDYFNVYKLNLNGTNIKNLSLCNCDILEINELYKLNKLQKFEFYGINQKIDTKKIIQNNPKLKLKMSIEDLPKDINNIKTKNLSIIEPITGATSPQHYGEVTIPYEYIQPLMNKIDEISKQYISDKMNPLEKVVMAMLISNKLACSNQAILPEILTSLQSVIKKRAFKAKKPLDMKLSSHRPNTFLFSSGLLYDHNFCCQAASRLCKAILKTQGIYTKCVGCDMFNSRKDDDVYYEFKHKFKSAHQIFKINIGEEWTYCDSLWLSSFFAKNDKSFAFFETPESFHKKAGYKFPKIEKQYSKHCLELKNEEKQMIIASALSKFIEEKTSLGITNPANSIEYNLQHNSIEYVFNTIVNCANSKKTTYYLDKNSPPPQYALINRKDIKKIIIRDEDLCEGLDIEHLKNFGYDNLEDIEIANGLTNLYEDACNISHAVDRYLDKVTELVDPNRIKMIMEER